MTNDTRQLQEVEADLIECYNSFQELYSQYHNLIYTMSFTPENSQAVKAFLRGITSLQNGFETLVQATKVVASAKGIQ